ncbi:septum formation protein Maf [Lysobacter sp. HDW10]|uniref:Maf family protein n=1 Tax=Lysobacter sp. HDW10 TaxID=2714936 RepID=UPI00140E1FBC|nr:Maf family protein [Lysobacter sp. HDW10]QIK80196.1 septum formation protein Maf [Lysobacter sp. HDW10]
MLYLASKSPRRADLLARLGVPFGLLDLDLPEVRLPNEPPVDYVSRVAREKAGAGLLKVMSNPSAVVLGSDTEVVLGDRVFGKPADRDDAREMLQALSGETHEVITVLWLVSAGNEVREVSTTRVRFGALDAALLDFYLAGNEWEGKAGAYAIQGAAQAFIAHVEGSPSGVMGLPLFETARALRKFGLFVQDRAQ